MLSCHTICTMPMISKFIVPIYVLCFMYIVCMYSRMFCKMSMGHCPNSQFIYKLSKIHYIMLKVRSFRLLWPSTPWYKDKLSRVCYTKLKVRSFRLLWPSTPLYSLVMAIGEDIWCQEWKTKTIFLVLNLLICQYLFVKVIDNYSVNQSIDWSIYFEYHKFYYFGQNLSRIHLEYQKTYV